MEVIGLDGKIYKWNPLNRSRDFSSASTYHVKAKSLIEKIYRYDIILEEVDLPGTKTNYSDTLRLDFYIPKYKIGIEVHGEQHYKHTKFFHADEKEFRLSQSRDSNKKRWCDSNNIELVILPYYNTEEEWRDLILCRENQK